ncbi:uncharacterized protein LOC130622130 [Hydractinia symbiolongicarpus]|uniref:uncharacterized protein LOC130622130 n=1 Tax=Hydractinia symbiolongicarpus TaxID=13093 RepID=UPI00254C8734|nr:uncharacterized protein LOC130622130 [Hydractinia symbiolongicarpus]
MKCLLKTLSMVVFLSSVQCSVTVTGIKGRINYDEKAPDRMPTNSCLVKRLIHSIDGKQDVRETKVEEKPSKFIDDTYEFNFTKPDMVESKEYYLVQIVLNVGWCSKDGKTNKSKDFTSGSADRNRVILNGKVEDAKIVGPKVKLRPASEPEPDPTKPTTTKITKNTTNKPGRKTTESSGSAIVNVYCPRQCPTPCPSYGCPAGCCVQQAPIVPPPPPPPPLPPPPPPAPPPPVPLFPPPPPSCPPACTPNVYDTFQCYRGCTIIQPCDYPNCPPTCSPQCAQTCSPACNTQCCNNRPAHFG